MPDRCHQELCPYWRGEGCLRGVEDCPDREPAWDGADWFLPAAEESESDHA